MNTEGDTGWIPVILVRQVDEWTRIQFCLGWASGTGVRNGALHFQFDGGLIGVETQRSVRISGIITHGDAISSTLVGIDQGFIHPVAKPKSLSKD